MTTAPIDRITRCTSQEHLNELLQAGLDSLEHGQGIEVTEDWWQQERAKLIERSAYKT